MKWVILDRDGVINHDSDNYIKSPEEWQPIIGSPEAVALLNAHGFKVVVVTNQSGIARGLYDLDTLERIHAKMHASVAAADGKITDIFYCPHGPEDNCNCRKPLTGLFEQFAQKYDVDLDGIPMVGDAIRDIQAAQRVGCAPLLVETGKGELTLERYPDFEFPYFANLNEAAKYIVRHYS
ncbi:D-glycero-beta-D-manno-heptose 1,7-bisphosphate 7-phosphatase [Candidatus Methylospira mobilis]|uniref:D,D-heptose 1,7-bisphosphate phosphatase n=1 Tax=Candidatus Methylospira mobilis TaxID=1808979 RepID=A0A5Q0BDY6_9GAMM|nr:D-glycero-beta-D-manno-heptose 1,7-bisphosphate 7-phosphatase [Candidatus Methylospira mobilis]QFY42065.1 D-glycero-beta-D-manno-heptose 1,7-bisphosphate 7-phosphatase [Candidatus Methylospira mobilis]WNV03072.1 D-glycero-beta-D-manno-heptose 1,7-bisphosphate 7-phosphatase [Candidatus Methylospira mobilis]